MFKDYNKIVRGLGEADFGRSLFPESRGEASFVLGRGFRCVPKPAGIRLVLKRKARLAEMEEPQEEGE